MEHEDKFHMGLILPPTKLARVRNDVDRYGFSDVLAKRSGINSSPRSFGAWLHGWEWWSVETPEELGYGSLPHDVPIIVRADSERDMLVRHGFQNVVAGGLPFAYVENSRQQRKRESLVAFLPHSLDYLDDPILDEEYLDFILSIKSGFSEVYCCIFWDDYKNSKAVEACNKRNIKVISGARPDDVNALRRMRAIFDYFDFATASSMGSHILYAAYCGCRVSLSGTYFAYPKELLDKDPHICRFPGYAERLVVAADKSKVMAQFPWLFLDHPMMAVQMNDWAKKEIGMDNMLDDAKIMEMLGWSPRARVKAISRGIIRRARRCLGDGIASCQKIFQE